jgi:hypothetical protein
LQPLVVVGVVVGVVVAGVDRVVMVEEEEGR